MSRAHLKPQPAIKSMLKEIFTLASKDPVLNDMVTSAKSLMGAATVRQKYAADWRKFGEKLKAFVNSQNPDVAEKMQTLSDLLNEVSDAENALAQDEIRNADDFRDIIERYAVLFRVNEEYLQAKLAYKRATDALADAIQKDKVESTKPTYDRNRPKLLAAIERSKAQKRASLIRFKEQTEALLDQRGRYTRFKVRKMVEGWTRYGNGLKRMCETETDIFQRIKEVLNELRESGNVNHEAVDQMERQIEQQAQAAPPPSPPPQDANEIPADPQFGGFD